jgi:curved DNA-binding protein
VILSITLPPADTEAAKNIYRKMEQELNFNPRAKLGV